MSALSIGFLASVLLLQNFASFDVVVYGLQLLLDRTCVVLVGSLLALFVPRHGPILICICEYKSNNRMHWLDV